MREHRRRNWFVLTFFLLGVLVPVAIMIFGSLVERPNPGSTVQGRTTAALWMIWPTWVLLFDAEHWYQYVPGMLIAAPLNGLWYAVVGTALWYIGRIFSTLSRTISGRRVAQR
jgi:hypothetical protein